MNLRARFFLLGLAGIVPLLLTAAAGSSPQGKGRPGVLSEDKGRFVVLVEGRQVGVEEFQINRSGADWQARGTVEIPVAGGTSKLTGKLRLTAQGAPIQYDYDWSPHGGKKVAATTVFQNGTAKIETQMEGTTPFTQEFKFGTPIVVVLDNNLYHQYAILAWLYDWEKKGSQNFPVLIPQDQTPGTITVEWMGAHAVEGQKLDSLRVRSADLEIELYLDASRRLVRLAVPAAKAEVVRQ